MKRLCPIFLAAAAFAGSPAPAGEPAALFPFAIPWDAAPEGFAVPLDAPAGRHGFIEAREGHLYAGKNRVRLFGVNVCFGACFPAPEDAEKIAARLARLGVGCVRFHHMDTLPGPDGLLRADRRTLDAGRLARLDFFIAALKKRGIYSDLNLHVGRVYPGMLRWPGMPEYGKGIDQFDPALIALQKEYARALLDHQNPHTGLRYAEEPAIAFVEINNEASLAHQWREGTLDDLPEPYRGTLEARWAEWLARSFPDDESWKNAVAERREPLGPELLREGKDAWALETHGAAMAALRPVTGDPAAQRVVIERPGGEDWHLQWNHPGLALAGGKPYTFSFRIAADRPRRVKVAVSQARPPWQPLWSAEIVAESGGRQETLGFTLPADEPRARIGFLDLGESPGVLDLAAPSLKEGQAGAPPESPASLGLIRRRDFASHPPALRDAWVRFLWEVEGGYWREMARFLKEEIGTRSLLIGTAADYSPAPLQAALDVIDAHGYWQHPQFEKGRWNEERWSVRNLPMAGTPGGGALARLAFARVEGKPFVCTEYAHAAPNSFSSESLPLLGACAALQGWDAVFAFAYSHRRDRWDTRFFPNFFDLDQHPAKLAHLPAAVNLFARGDLAPATRRFSLPLSKEEAPRRWLLAGAPLRGDAPSGLPWQAFLLGRVSLGLDTPEGAPPSPVVGEDAFVFSDGGRLGWGRGTTLLNTAGTWGVIGGEANRRYALGEVSITPGATRRNWAAILVSEGVRVGSSRRFLITATGEAENTGMEWSGLERESVGRRWGRAPSLVEGIPATIAFSGLRRLRAWALDERGGRRREIPVRGGRVGIGPEYRTLWYELEGIP